MCEEFECEFLLGTFDDKGSLTEEVGTGRLVVTHGGRWTGVEGLTQDGGRWG